MKPFINALIFVCSMLWSVNSQQINCGQTRVGNRASNEEVEFLFVADQDYTQVYLEGCDSTHDILLHIENSNGVRILSVDDGNDHGIDIDNCATPFSGDITIPGSVSQGDRYTFIVDGYQDESGQYTVQLFCQGGSSGSNTPAPTPPPVSSPGEDCPRDRKEWNTATQAERNLYINGLLALSEAGILRIFTEQHGQLAAEAQAHSTSAFLPWHRQFLWELETQIRNLGGEYECFALLYWNWGLDVDQFRGNYDSYSVMNSGLGSRGDSTNNYCVTDGPFRSGQYVPYHCPVAWQSNNGECCLRRFTASASTTTNLWPSTTNEVAVTLSSSYGSDIDDNGFQGINEWIQFGPHGTAHCTFGGCGGALSTSGHLGNGLYSPDDPIFYLLHAQVDYMWALWQDYHNYDEVHRNNIDSDVYFGGLPNSDIDDVMVFDVFGGTSWSTTRGTERIRSVHSIQDMGYRYEYGSFIDDVEFPTANLDDNWFYEDAARRRRRRRLKNDDSIKFEKIAYQQLVDKYGEDEVNTYEGRRKLVQTLDKMSCEFRNTGGYECERPAYFDDCSDMERGPNIYNNKMDINVTLDELIEKVADYPCMVETRKLMYGFVAELGGLWRLCRGDFDRFCDKEFLINRPRQNQCEARGYRKEKRNRRSESVGYGNIDGIGSQPENTSFYNRDWMDIIINAGVNGVVIMFMLLIACFIWMCYTQFIQKPSSGYDKVQKYIDNDTDI